MQSRDKTAWTVENPVWLSFSPSWPCTTSQLWFHASFIPPSIMKSSQFSGEEDPERTNVTARDRGINTFRVRECYAPCSSVNYQTKILSQEGKERIRTNGGSVISRLCSWFSLDFMIAAFTSMSLNNVHMKWPRTAIALIIYCNSNKLRERWQCSEERRLSKTHRLFNTSFLQHAISFYSDL